MLATHVWRTHEVWADEYRAYFGLSAKRGLVGTDTSAKLRAAATEYLVPHHDAAVELAREATRGKPLRERGPRIRLETRLDPAYQAALPRSFLRGLRAAFRSAVPVVTANDLQRRVRASASSTGRYRRSIARAGSAAGS